MIQNIVLDMGNVITEFAPEHFVQFYADTEAQRQKLVQTIFRSREYKQLDLGTISYQEATRIWQSREPELADAIAQVSDHWYEHKELVVPINQLAVLLKEKGYGLYLLSNASDKYPLYKDKVPALKAMDGEILSYEHHVLKPDHQLYQILFETFQLDPGTCFFVDDLPGNIQAGRELGMEGFVFPKDVDAVTAVKRLLDALGACGITIDYSEVEAVKL